MARWPRTFMEAGSLDELERVFRTVPREAENAVRRENRGIAKTLRELIKPEVPYGYTPGMVRNSHPDSRAHEYEGKKRAPGSPPGTMRKAIKSGAAVNYARVYADHNVAPHFAVNEFGGAVRWFKAVSKHSPKAHAIPVRRRSATIKSQNLLDHSGTQRGSVGWFFFPTAARYIPEMRLRHADRMHEVMEQTFGQL